MSVILERLVFSWLEAPNIQFRRPSWFALPSKNLFFGFAMLTYFLFVGGIVYDVIIEPHSMGTKTDSMGRTVMEPFLLYRMNGQYIMEGLVSSMMFVLGGTGLVLLTMAQAPGIRRFNRYMTMGIGSIMTVLPYLAARLFISIKLPYYLSPN
ncbi:hypothetical protein SNEBB_000658 [Seison nebaliae]|nr:hypothetical protein SNEBB_000658 [Seison nebaliae]